MDTTWGIGCDSSGHVTPRRNGCNGFPPTSAAGRPPRRSPSPAHQTLLLCPIFPSWMPSGTAASTATTDEITVKDRWQRFSCLDDLPAAFRRFLEPPPQPLLPPRMRQDRPTRRTADARRRCTERVVGSGKPHPE